MEQWDRIFPKEHSYNSLKLRFHDNFIYAKRLKQQIKYIVKMNQENIISNRILPQYEINDAHSRWNYHRILETGNKKMAKMRMISQGEILFAFQLCPRSQTIITKKLGAVLDHDRLNQCTQAVWLQKQDFWANCLEMIIQEDIFC